MVVGTVGAVTGPENWPFVSAYGPKSFPPTCTRQQSCSRHLPDNLPEMAGPTAALQSCYRCPDALKASNMEADPCMKISSSSRNQSAKQSVGEQRQAGLLPAEAHVQADRAGGCACARGVRDGSCDLALASGRGGAGVVCSGNDRLHRCGLHRQFLRI